MELDLIEKIKELFTNIAFDLHRVNNYLSKDNNHIAAMFYLNLANADAAIVKSIYYCNYEKLAHNDVENLLNQFDMLVSEVTRNFATNHSHQWSNIEYEKFKEMLQDIFNISTGIDE